MMTNSLKPPLNTAFYIRLSREDGDKAESMSISNQRLLLTQFLKGHKELLLYDTYIDDGYTGTDFERPSFRRMLADIEKKRLQCVVVKDLSRLGRNMPKVTEYVSEYFPARKVRFIAVDDGIDKEYCEIDAGEDMMIDLKNMFNGFYPKDISRKVRSTLRSKQENGQFIGAFASFGYRKSETDRNRLVIDEYAACVVRRIFNMYINGMGQNTIARRLNEEGIPSPSEYKKRCGLNYRNSSRSGSLWTYSTVRKILRNEIYTGNMVQNKSFRQVCKKNAVSLPREKWVIVENTHAPVISKDTFERVQELLEKNTRQTDFSEKIHPFAGLLKCGDCGKPTAKIKRRERVFFHCGSYNRYGKNVCSMHAVSQEELETAVLRDLNRIIKSVKNLKFMGEEEEEKFKKEALGLPDSPEGYRRELERLEQKKDRAYEDFLDDVISREEFLRYKEKYEQRMEAVRVRAEAAERRDTENAVIDPWLEGMLSYGRIGKLDRQTVAEMISMIYVYENKTIKIVYQFSEHFHQNDIPLGE